MFHTMASLPHLEAIDYEEQLARLRKINTENERMLIEMQKMSQETLKLIQDTQKSSLDVKFATPQVIFQGLLAIAAMLGAGAALAKLFG